MKMKTNTQTKRERSKYTTERLILPVRTKVAKNKITNISVQTKRPRENVTEKLILPVRTKKAENEIIDINTTEKIIYVPFETFGADIDIEELKAKLFAATNILLITENYEGKEIHEQQAVETPTLPLNIQKTRIQTENNPE
jgi:hypothetical protein